MADIAKFVEEIKGLTVMELADLVKAIEEEFGVSAAAPVMVAGPAAGAAAAEAKTHSVSLRLTAPIAGAPRGAEKSLRFCLTLRA